MVRNGKNEKIHCYQSSRKSVVTNIQKTVVKEIKEVKEVKEVKRKFTPNL